MKRFLPLLVLFLPLFSPAQAILPVPDIIRDSAYIADSLRYAEQYKADSTKFASRLAREKLKKEMEINRLELELKNQRTMRWAILLAIPIGIAALVLLIIFLVRRFS